MGLGWTRVAEALAARIPPAEIKRVWVFPRMRRDEREWGTAVVARRVAEERFAVYTARYVLIVRGREKGQGKVEIEQIGLANEDVIEDVLRGVQERAGEIEPPEELDPGSWYGGSDDDPASEG